MWATIPLNFFSQMETGYWLAAAVSASAVVLAFYLRERTRAAEKLKEIDDLKKESFRLSEENVRLQVLLSEERVRLVEEKKRLDEQKVFFQETEKKALESFKSLSHEVFSDHTKRFLELAETRFEKVCESQGQVFKQRQESLTNFVKPLSEVMKGVDGKLQALDAAWKEQVRSLIESQTLLGNEAKQLSQALRIPHIRGQWGELQLKRVVEMAGLVEQCDFTCQESLGTERKRPDVVITLPGERRLVIDAKAPLQAYLEGAESDETSLRQEKFKEHAKALRSHISQLGGKNYWNQFQRAPEFVVLFLPGESFFSEALRSDPTLIEYGAEQKVMLTTPMTLLALLRVIAFGWKEEKLAKNAEKISELGRELHERFTSTLDHFEELKRCLEKSVEAYNRTAGSIEKRVLVSLRKLEEHGAASKNVKDLACIEVIARDIKQAVS